MYRLLRHALFTLEPERAHSLALSTLGAAHTLRLLPSVPVDPAEAITLMGLRFPNRLGLAAGFDKNARHIDALGALGFGFVEVGTVTPRPQPGQGRPRLFRSPLHSSIGGALINRMGFPNEGSAACAARLARRTYTGICGVNIGKNAATPIGAAIDDYVSCYRDVAAYADYVAVNVSSPNTQDLRRLQQVEHLQPILESLLTERERLKARLDRPLPLLIKISPDLSEDELLDVARLLVRSGVDGVIATNTTITRPGFVPGTTGKPGRAPTDISSFNAQAGGLSGEPLRSIALQTIRILRSTLGKEVPIIGVGGISRGADALAALDAGADLVQIYTGLIYRGPRLIREIRAAFRSGDSSGEDAGS